MFWFNAWKKQTSHTTALIRTGRLAAQLMLLVAAWISLQDAVCLLLYAPQYTVKIVSVQCTLKRGTKYTAKEESALKRLNISSELARQGNVGLKAFLTVVLCSTALWKSGEANKINQFIYNSFLNGSVFFCLIQSLLHSWNSHVKTQAILMNFCNIDPYIIRNIVTLLGLP